MKAETGLLDSENELDNTVNVASFWLTSFCQGDEEQDIPLFCTNVNRQQKRICSWGILCVGFSIKIQNLGQMPAHVCVELETI